MVVHQTRELHCSKWIEIEGTSGNAGILPASGFAGFQPASRRQDACVPRDFAVLLVHRKKLIFFPKKISLLLFDALFLTVRLCLSTMGLSENTGFIQNMQNKLPQTKKNDLPREPRSLESSGERKTDSSPRFDPCLSRSFQEKPAHTAGSLSNARSKKWSPHLYFGFFLAVLSAIVNFGGCCTPTSKTQILGQTRTSEWDTPSENVRQKRNFLTPVLTFLKRDTEEDHILVGKPAPFANPDKRSEWEIQETPENQLKQHTVAISPSPPPPPILQVAHSSPIPTTKEPKKVASLPTDSQEILDLISALNAHESVNSARAESFLAELRKMDRSQIPPEFYQYAIDRVRSELIVVPPEPVNKVVAVPKQASPNLQRKKTPGPDSEKLTKSVPKIEITEAKTTEERPAAPAPTPTTLAETRVVEASCLASHNDIPVGRFNEPGNETVSIPRVNPTGYSSQETFRDFANDSPWIASPAQKYGSSPLQDWEQATLFAIAALKNRVIQAPDPDTAITDQLRLQILETTLYGRNVPGGNSQYCFAEYDETIQGFVNNELLALTTLLDENNSPEFATRLQTAQPHFQEAQRQLTKSCSLKIRNMQFIQNDDPQSPKPGDFRGFGVYTPIKAEFRPNDWAWVYLEMENFVTNGNETVGFNTKFSISYEILDASGNSVLKKSLPMTEETTKSPRRDMALTVPLDLLDILPGHYRALIRVIDQNHIRLPMDTQRIDFIVRAEPR